MDPKQQEIEQRIIKQNPKKGKGGKNESDL